MRRGIIFVMRHGRCPMFLVAFLAAFVPARSAIAQMEHVLFVTSVSYVIDSGAEPNPSGDNFGGLLSAGEAGAAHQGLAKFYQFFTIYTCCRHVVSTSLTLYVIHFIRKKHFICVSRNQLPFKQFLGPVTQRLISEKTIESRCNHRPLFPLPAGASHSVSRITPRHSPITRSSRRATSTSTGLTWGTGAPISAK